ncbi:MAG: hypothetical protein AAFQ82_21105 [Myxococcota bacterium]
MDTLVTEHPAGKKGTRVNRASYDAYRKVILSVVPKSQAGIAFSELPEKVKAEIAPEFLTDGERCGWWVTTVKLDLEAKGLLERFGSPQRLRRT